MDAPCKKALLVSHKIRSRRVMLSSSLLIEGTDAAISIILSYVACLSIAFIIDNFALLSRTLSSNTWSQYDNIRLYLL